MKRTNEKTVQEWNETIRGLACVPECVAMYSGLDLSRETSTHYMQEMLLQTHLRVAVEVEVPLILHMVQSVERVAELAQQEDSLPAVAVFHFAASPAQLAALSSAFHGQLYLVLTGLVCPRADAPEEERDAEAARARDLRDLLAAVPPERVLAATNCPNATPQSIPDEYMRQVRAPRALLAHYSRTSRDISFPGAAPLACEAHAPGCSRPG